MALKTFGLSETVCSVLPFGVTKPITGHKKEARLILQERHHVSEREKILLFAGTLDYTPNADAVNYIYESLLPALNKTALAYKIIICGRNQNPEFHYLSNFKNERVIFAKEVANVETYYTGADVFINPVTLGGGVQTKTIEALSYGLNVVCFDNKFDGIMEAKQKLFSVPAQNWDLFANAILLALHNNIPTPEKFFIEHNWGDIAATALAKISVL
jgi:hypothetical protein